MLSELLIKRRSIRKYEKRKIEAEKINELKKVALLSPTSRNKRGWEFLFVDDIELLGKLSQTKPSGGQMLKDAALGVIITVNDENNDVWIEDGSIAAAYIHLAAYKMGLGSCWVQIRNRMKDYENDIESGKEIQNILGIPENQKVICAIAIGYPAETIEPYNEESLEYEKIHINIY